MCVVLLRSRLTRSTSAYPSCRPANAGAVIAPTRSRARCLKRLADLRQRVARRDVRQMRQPLREIAQQLAGLWRDLLREQPEIVGLGDRQVEHLACLLDLAAARQALDEPERAAQKRALLPGQTVIAAVAVEQALAGVELLPDRRDRPQHLLVVPRDVLDSRQ